jgi:adenosylcobinamide-GDP ribazoletransferase
MITPFFLALQFLTRIPVPINLVVSNEQWGKTVLFYPLVGLIIGHLLALIVILLPENSVTLQAAIVLTFWVLITGGLHLDGLADCADAWAGSLDNPQRSLEIMKDPRSGAIAVVTLILVLLLKWTALSELLRQQDFLSHLIIIPVLGRCAILGLMLSTNYVSRHGLGEKLNAYLPKAAATAILLISMIVGFYIMGYGSLIFAILIIFSIRLLSQQRLGGVTGDVYGASVELVETGLLIAVVL